jgi:hypothetical protein
VLLAGWARWCAAAQRLLAVSGVSQLGAVVLTCRRLQLSLAVMYVLVLEGAWKQI